MREAGVHVHLDTNGLGTVGISEALVTFPRLLQGFLRLRREVRKRRPDVAVLIGNDVFNFFLARWLRLQKVSTVAFFPPQIWMWRSLARLICGSFDLILTSFPEEQEVYRAAGGSTCFVGHYLCDVLAPATPQEKAEARRLHALNATTTVIALLPGSRNKEVMRLTGTLLDSARLILARDPSLRFVLPVAEPCFQSFIEREIQRHSLSENVILTLNSHDALRACDLALLASGTASLEAALLGVPMIVLYRVSTVTLMVANIALWCGLLQSKTVGLPNLILRETCVPELRQTRATARESAQLAWSMLSDRTHLARTTTRLASIADLLAAKDPLGAAASLVLKQTSQRPAAAHQQESNMDSKSATEVYGRR
jgi:lipid-A-disaccharide synthase